MAPVDVSQVVPDGYSEAGATPQEPEEEMEDMTILYIP